MNESKKIVLRGERDCTGCGACIATCPKGAIAKEAVGLGAWIPRINPELCICCGLCVDVCADFVSFKAEHKKAYVVYNRDTEMRLKSASGGIFSALATHVLEHGGVVFGAEMRFESGKAIVEHCMISEVQELPRILTSKYVQSDCVSAYKQAKVELAKGKVVLFSGCSCQITGLKNYLRNSEQKNLYTIDLICHGTPGIDLFNDYIRYLEDKYKGSIENFAFRAKRDGKILYQITAFLRSNGNKDFYRTNSEENELHTDIKEVVIPMRNSGYYRLFLSEESYRKACYSCPYASLDKPADITIGDYFEIEQDYPELLEGKDAIDCSSGISCAITHTSKGEQLISDAKERLYIKRVDPKVVQASHGNLHKPSKHSIVRLMIKVVYPICGYGVAEAFYKMRNGLVDVFKTVLGNKGKQRF